jgi:hypothetical protein
MPISPATEQAKYQLDMSGNLVDAESGGLES